MTCNSAWHETRRTPSLTPLARQEPTRIETGHPCLLASRAPPTVAPSWLAGMRLVGHARFQYKVTGKTAPLCKSSESYRPDAIVLRDIWSKFKRNLNSRTGKDDSQSANPSAEADVDDDDNEGDDEGDQGPNGSSRGSASFGFFAEATSTVSSTLIPI